MANLTLIKFLKWVSSASHEHYWGRTIKAGLLLLFGTTFGYMVARIDNTDTGDGLLVAMLFLVCCWIACEWTCWFLKAHYESVLVMTDPRERAKYKHLLDLEKQQPRPAV